MPDRSKTTHAVDPRQLPSKRWQGRVVYWDPTTGKRRELTQMFDNAKLAKAWSEAETVRLRATVSQAPPQAMTIEAFLAQWLGGLTVEPNTLRTYRQQAAHIIREWGTQPLTDLTTLKIQQFYTRHRETHSQRSVNYVHTVLRMALETAVDWGLIAKNPADKAKAPRGTREALVIPTPEETAKLLRAAEGTRWYALWAWSLVTGCRMGEVLAVQWDHVDWERQIVLIREAVSGAGSQARLKKPKGASQGRVIDLGSHIMDVLRAQQALQAQWREAAGDRWEETGRIFTTYLGTPFGSRNVDRAFKQTLERAGLAREIRVHDLRHAMATEWLAAGVPAHVVSARLGHTSVAFTLQTYAHVLPQQQANWAQTMEPTLNPAAVRSTDDPHQNSNEG